MQQPQQRAHRLIAAYGEGGLFCAHTSVQLPSAQFNAKTMVDAWTSETRARVRDKLDTGWNRLVQVREQIPILRDTALQLHTAASEFQHQADIAGNEKSQRYANFLRFAGNVVGKDSGSKHADAVPRSEYI